MSSDKTKSNALKLLTYTGLTCITAAIAPALAPAAGASGIMAFAPSVANNVMDTMHTVFGNVTSNYYEKVNYKDLQNWLLNAAKDMPNHDLLRAFQDAMIESLEMLYNDYSENLATIYKNYDEPYPSQADFHSKAIKRKIESLQTEIEQNFLKVLGDEVSEKELQNFADKQSQELLIVAEQFIGVEDLKKHGKVFPQFFKDRFPECLQFQFSKQLKAKPKAWVAFQRLWMQDVSQTLRAINDVKLKTVIEQLNTWQHQLSELEESIAGKMGYEAFKLSELIEREFKGLKGLELSVTSILDSKMVAITTSLEFISKEVTETKTITNTGFKKINVRLDTIEQQLKTPNPSDFVQYREWEVTLKSLNKRFISNRKLLDKYPDDEDFELEKLEIDKERVELQKRMKIFIRQVRETWERLLRIPTNSVRLKLAMEYFSKGDLYKTQAILDAEEMTEEQDKLLENKIILKRATKENNAKLRQNANEFSVKAQVTALEYNLSNRIEKTKEYFEKSLKADRNVVNLSAYALFLQTHNKNDKAASLYEEVLKEYRVLVDENPKKYLSCLADILNKLALIQMKKSEFRTTASLLHEALEIYIVLSEINKEIYEPHIAHTLNDIGILRKKEGRFKEAKADFLDSLKIYERLIKSNRQTFLSYYAQTLNNLSNLRGEKNDFNKAEGYLQETLKIYKELRENNKQQTYLPKIGIIFLNLGVTQWEKNDFKDAESSFHLALTIYQLLVKINSQAHLPVLGKIWNNLANTQRSQKEFKKAELAFYEALEIYQVLIKENKKVYSPLLAMTQINLALFFIETSQRREDTIELAFSSIKNSVHFQNTPQVKEYINTAIKVLQVLEVDIKKLFKEKNRIDLLKII